MHNNDKLTIMQNDVLTIANTKSPLITFIIPCYNVPPQLLRRCLHSIITLDMQIAEREIIIIDDGSDVSQKVSLGSLTKDVIYIHQEHAGLSVARNTGIDNAHGEYIQFVDADDMLNTNVYSCSIKAIRMKRFDLIIFDYDTRTQLFDKPLPVMKLAPSVSGPEYMLKNNLRVMAWGYVFKRELVEHVRFSPGLLHEDEEFTPLLMLGAKSVTTFPAKVYIYQKHKGSIMSREDLKHINKRLNDTTDIIISLNQAENMLEGVKKEAIKRRVSQLSMNLIYDIIKLTHSQNVLNDHISTLKQYGLYPLPLIKYTKKYYLFALMVNNPVGINILMKVL